MYTYCLLVRSKHLSVSVVSDTVRWFCRLGDSPRPFRIQKGLIVFPFQASIAVQRRVSCVYRAVKFLAGPPQQGPHIYDILGGLLLDCLL
eukprot:SAG31_NODE_13512_length_864_cov_1.256209_1_plen_89_part_10